MKTLSDYIKQLPIFSYGDSISLEKIAEDIGMKYDPETTQEELAEAILATI